MFPTPAKFSFLSGLFPALPFSLLDMVLLAGILWLVTKRKDIFYEKNNVLEFDTSVRIKGLLAVLIVLHHLSINTPGTMLFQAFTSIGTMVVAVFFFYSGFGLMGSYLKKPNYLRGFFSKRIVKLLIPYCMALLITYYVTLLTQYKLTPHEIVQSFFDSDPVVPYSWYVLAILFFYTLFYLSARLFPHKAVINGVILVGTICYCFYSITQVSFSSWWLSSCFSFFAGVHWASYREVYLARIKNTRKLIIAAAILAGLGEIAMGVQFLTSGFSLETLKQVREISDWVMTRPLPILFLNVVCFSMVIVFFCIMERVKLNEKVFGFLGKISFEIYLYHGLVMLLLRNAFWYLPGDLPYSLCVMGLSIALAWLMHKVHNFSISFTVFPQKYCLSPAACGEKRLSDKREAFFYMNNL